jgi:hypothetical protein
VAIGSLGHVELFGVGVDDLGREGGREGGREEWSER